MALLDGLSFGWRTALLLVMFIQLLLLALSLTRALQNRIANRTMAVLLLVLAGILIPWMIGFAGFYDKWMWLTFAPFQISLAVAPLFYLYAYAIVTGQWPDRGYWHLAPAALQFFIYTASFLLPFTLKMQWADLAAPAFTWITSIGIMVGLAYYCYASLRLLQHYRAALAAARSDGHRYAALWLGNAIFALALLLLIWTSFLVWDLLSPLGYSGLMWLYVAIGAFALYLGIEAWRHATLAFPPIDSLKAVADTLPPPRDWIELGKLWAEKVKAEDWAADPDLSLATLARKLGTNSGHLSRAINEGLGVNFATFVNDLRARSVAAMMMQGRQDDLLDLALEAGFSSKASFNRAFAATFGTTPSQWRKRQVSNHEYMKDSGF